MYNTTVPICSTKSGNCYEIPRNIETENFYSMIYEFVNLAKEKGLTVRQAQMLFKACEDYVLESTLLI